MAAFISYLSLLRLLAYCFTDPVGNAYFMFCVFLSFVVGASQLPYDIPYGAKSTLDSVPNGVMRPLGQWDCDEGSLVLQYEPQALPMTDMWRWCSGFCIATCLAYVFSWLGARSSTQFAPGGRMRVISIIIAAVTFLESGIMYTVLLRGTTPTGCFVSALGGTTPTIRIFRPIRSLVHACGVSPPLTMVFGLGYAARDWRRGSTLFLMLLMLGCNAGTIFIHNQALFCASVAVCVVSGSVFTYMIVVCLRRAYQSAIASDNKSLVKFLSILAVPASTAAFCYFVGWLLMLLNVIDPYYETVILSVMDVGMAVTLCQMWQIADWKSAEESITQQIQAIEEQRTLADARNSAKRTFMRYIFHELRVPLNAIVLGLDDMAAVNGDVSDAVGEVTLAIKGPLRPHEALLTPPVTTIAASATSLASTAQLVIGNATAMSKLLDDFLSLEKIEEGKFEIEPVQFRVRDMVDDAAHMFAAPLASKGLQLHVDVSSIVPETIKGDVHKLRQVLCNYISNAIKFSPSGARITLRVAVVLLPSSAVGVGSGVVAGYDVQAEAMQVHVADVPDLGAPARKEYSSFNSGSVLNRVMSIVGSVSRRLRSRSASVHPMPLAPSSSADSVLSAQQQVPGADPRPLDSYSLTTGDTGVLAGADTRMRIRVPFGGSAQMLELSSGAGSAVSASSPLPAAEQRPHGHASERASNTPDAVGTAGSVDATAGSSASSTPVYRDEQRFRHSKMSRFVRFSVTDQGVGISLEDQSKLFQPFTQIKAGALQKGNGTGLGLSICKRIIELSGGRVGIHSSEGKGSTFCFGVPVSGPPMAPAPAASAEPVPASNDAALDNHHQQQSSVTIAVQSPDQVLSRPDATAQTAAPASARRWTFGMRQEHADAKASRLAHSTAGISPSSTDQFGRSSRIAPAAAHVPWKITPPQHSTTTDSDGHAGTAATDHSISLSPAAERHQIDAAGRHHHPATSDRHLAVHLPRLSMTGIIEPTGVASSRPGAEAHQAAGNNDSNTVHSMLYHIESLHSMSLASRSSSVVSPSAHDTHHHRYLAKRRSSNGQPSKPPHIAIHAEPVLPAAAALPVAQQVSQGLPSEVQAAIEVTTAELPSKSHQQEGRSLLVSAVVVDDVKSNREFFGRMLARRGVTTIHFAEDGQQALLLLDTLSPNQLASIQCWFLDKEMPNCDGHQCATTLRARDVTVPIFGVTGNALAEDRREFISAGASAVITKPVRASDLELALLSACLELPKAARSLNK